MLRMIAAQAEEGGGLNPFDPEFGLYIWTLVAFVVVFYLLAKKVFPKLGETLSDRERRIKDDLERAEHARRDADKTFSEYKSRIAQAREESNRMLEEARQSAEQVRADLVRKAEAESRLIVDKAQKELSGEKDRAVSDLQRQLAAWSAEIASRILEKEIDPETQRDLVESFIRDVGRRNGSQ